jgi:hypothetical protein
MVVIQLIKKLKLKEKIIERFDKTSIPDGDYDVVELISPRNGPVLYCINEPQVIYEIYEFLLVLTIKEFFKILLINK